MRKTATTELGKLVAWMPLFEYKKGGESFCDHGLTNVIFVY